MIEKQFTYARFQLSRNTQSNFSIGAITYSDPMKKLFGGSAFLISPNLILTAASNIYDHQYASQNEDFKFYLASPTGIVDRYFQVEDWRYPVQFTNANKPHYNYALMKLKIPVHYNKFQQLRIPCKFCILQNNQKTIFKIFGYPIDQKYNNYESLDKYGTIFYLNQYGTSVGNRVLNEVSQQIIGYQIKVENGQSGCPVIVGEQVIAIHVQQKQQFNVGKLIDNKMAQKIIQWSKELKGLPFEVKQQNPCFHLQPNLTQLNLSHQKMPVVFVTKNTQLLNLNLSYNMVSEIDLTNNINLVNLNLSSNKLLKIDFSNNINLCELDLRDNSISQINIANNTKLTQLNLYSNQLPEIDVNNSIELSLLDIYNNQLYEIDITKNINLTHLFLGYNNIAEIDLSNNTKLIQLNLQNNQISEINISKNINLTQLILGSNQLYKIDISNNINLMQLQLWNNKLQEIDTVKNINLTQLSLSSNILALISICYTSKIQYQYFQSQRSSICRVQIFHNENESQECQKKKEQWKDKYEKMGMYHNQHGCNYVFSTIKIIDGLNKTNIVRIGSAE